MSVSKVCIQTSVLFGIFAQYQRRAESCPVRLVGALLGSVSPVEEGMTTGGNTFAIELYQCFPVPHSEVGDQISINSEYFRMRMSLHRKGYGKDVVLLGWYSIQMEGELPKNTDEAAFSKNAEFIRDYFARETGATGAPLAVYLAITIGKDGRIRHEAFSCEAIKLSASNSGMLQSAATRSFLTKVPCELAYGMPELFTLDVVTKALIEGNFSRDGKEGKVMLSVPSLKDYRSVSNAQISNALEQINKIAQDTRDPEGSAKANSVLELLGLTNVTAEDKRAFDEDSAALDNALGMIRGQLVRASELMLGTQGTNTAI